MKHVFVLAVAAMTFAGCATSTQTTQPPAIPVTKAASAETMAAPQAMQGTPGSRLGKVDAEGYTVIFDGTWDGWRVNELPRSWSIVDRAFRANGGRSHCFYIGSLAPFKDFELKLDILTEPGSNGGVYIHTKFQNEGWPWGGYETQVNQTHTDWKKSGSIYDVKDVKEVYVKDNQWYTHHVVVKGGNIKVYLNEKLVNEFTEEPGRQPGKDFERKLNQGTFALQSHDPKSVVLYRNIRVKKL